MNEMGSELTTKNTMMQAKFNTDDLTKKAKSQLAQFAIEAPLDLEYREARIDGTHRLDTDEILVRLNFEHGQIVNKSNTVSIVFDRDNLPDKHQFNQDLLDTPANGVRDYKNGDNLVFEFDDGESLISSEFVDLVENIYKIDIRENPEIVKGNGDDDNWPVRIEDNNAETYIMIAPRIPQ